MTQKKYVYYKKKGIFTKKLEEKKEIFQRKFAYMVEKH